MTWHPLSPATYELGESPFWHPQEQRLYWLDIPGKKVLRANLNGSDMQAWDLPTEPGCMAPATSGGLVIALRNEFPCDGGAGINLSDPTATIEPATTDDILNTPAGETTP